MSMLVLFPFSLIYSPRSISFYFLRLFFSSSSLPLPHFLSHFMPLYLFPPFSFSSFSPFVSPRLSQFCVCILSLPSFGFTFTLIQTYTIKAFRYPPPLPDSKFTSQRCQWSTLWFEASQFGCFGAESKSTSLLFSFLSSFIGFLTVLQSILPLFSYSLAVLQSRI